MEYKKEEYVCPDMRIYHVSIRKPIAQSPGYTGVNSENLSDRNEGYDDSDFE